MADAEHLEVLREGRKHWNQWQEERLPDQTADLSGADLRGVNLFQYDLAWADLSGADLRGAHLERVDLDGAQLVGAKLAGTNVSWANLEQAVLRTADLAGANLQESDFSWADLSDADLTGANLQRARLIRTTVEGARLSQARIYGIAAWDLRGEPREQEGLVITQDEEPRIEVDDLEIAQFVYLIYDNRKLKRVIDTVTSKAVLILGRFTPEPRKAVLEALRGELRSAGYLPIVFDFEKPKDRDFTETVRTLVGLCHFVVVDLTNPRSSPLELDATVPDYMVPFVPILEDGQPPFSMFVDLHTKYHWMLPDLVTYKSVEALRAVTKELIIDRAFEKYKEIQSLKTQQTGRLSAEQFLAGLARDRS
jgi:pentapeptide repeat protein